MTKSTVIGLDIGGANLKVCALDSMGNQVAGKSLPFALWKTPQQLGPVLNRELENLAPGSSFVGVTMSGELADCFTDKKAGVQFIVDCVDKTLNAHTLLFYQVTGQFVSACEAKETWNRTAAANWHALAQFVADDFDIDRGWLIDIGSTTSDFVYLRNRSVCSQSQSDLDRLRQHELLYSGAWRTPVCAVASYVELETVRIPVAHELFATMADVYVVTGDLPEDESCSETSDGRSLTRENSLRRLAKCVCCDVHELGEHAIVQLARQISRQQLALMRQHYTRFRDQGEFDACHGAPEKDTIVLSGAGEFLAKRLIEDHPESTRIVSLSQEWGAQTSSIAPAFAVAQLGLKRSIR